MLWQTKNRSQSVKRIGSQSKHHNLDDDDDNNDEEEKKHLTFALFSSYANFYSLEIVR